VFQVEARQGRRHDAGVVIRLAPSGVHGHMQGHMQVLDSFEGGWQLAAVKGTNAPAPQGPGG